MQQPAQHIPLNLGQSTGGLDSNGHQSAMFPNVLPHSSMSTDALTSALSLLPPELLQSHQHQQHLHSTFAQLTSSQPGSSASLLSHVHNQLQPAAQSLIAQQQSRGSPSQPSQLPEGQPSHPQQSRRRPQPQRQSSHHKQHPRHQSQPQQQQPLQGQQSQPHQQQGNIHVNAQQHPSSGQPQHQSNIAQLLGTHSDALGVPQSSLLHQHASILSDARSSVSTFSQAMHDAKQASPGDRGDIRNVISMLERASKALVSELDQGVNKLRALSNSPTYNNVTGLLNASSANLLGQDSNSGHDLFGTMNNFGLPGPGMQQHQQQPSNAGGLPFDLGMGFQQGSAATGLFNMTGVSNSNAANGGSSGFNSGFSDDIGGRGNGQQGAGSQNTSFLPALLAQYLSQNTDPSSRNGTLSLFQSLNNRNANGPFPNSMQGLEALLNQGLPQQRQQPHSGSTDIDGGRSHLPHTSAQLSSDGAPLSNAAALAALTSLGITPTMLEALGLGSVAQQMLNAPVDGGNNKDSSNRAQSQGRTSPEERDDSSEAELDDLTSEPARKKRKQARSKPAGTASQVNTEASSSKQPSQTPDAHHASKSRLSHSATPGNSTPKVPLSSHHLDRNPNNPNVPGPSDTSKRIPTLGVGLRQEGDKRYRNRKLLRDLREHLYRWLGTDEFRKLRSTYKVAEWVPNAHLTEEEKQILASLPAGAVAQPPITTHIFHVDFTSRDFYRTNQSLIDAIVTEGSKKVEAKPEAYAIVPGTIDRDHLEDVAKDLMDSARSGFRMSLRTGLQAEKEDKEKHEKYRGVERAKTKCRNREIGAGRLRHAIPKQLLIPGAYSDDAASDEDLHGLTKSEWKRQRLRKLRIAKGWEAVTPKWRNKHLTRAYHKADIVSKSKQMARWRRDNPVDLPIPIKLYGKMLPKQLFDPEWLAEHRKELEDEPYCIRINDNDIEGWEEGHHPLGEDTSDEMEWSDAKESSMRGRQMMSVGGRDGRASTTHSPAPVVSKASEGGESAAAVATVSRKGESLATEAEDTPAEADDAVRKVAVTSTVSEGSGTSSVSSSSRSGAGDTGGSDTDSESSVVVGDAVDGIKTKATVSPTGISDTAAETSKDTAPVAADQPKPESDS
ncbi:hypothetical protein PHBOTO_003794 [Pseudozyma hubeiensis]|nr:hypothetical protein PHBOTO_003794 [Pseudozyma hubeiensis]